MAAILRGRNRKATCPTADIDMDMRTCIIGTQNFGLFDDLLRVKTSCGPCIDTPLNFIKEAVFMRSCPEQNCGSVRRVIA